MTIHCRSVVLPLLMLLALVGCSKREAALSAPPVQTSAVSAAQLAEVAETHRRERLAQPAADVALEQYQELKSGNQLMFQYYARSGMPINAESVAQAISSDYRNASDAFRQRELLDALRPRIERSLADAAASPYLHMEIDGSLLSPYDFERKGFPLQPFQESGSSRYFQDNAGYKIEFTNDRNYAFLPVADEAAARETEALRAKYQALKLRVYLFAQDADTSRQQVKAVITRIVLADSRGKVLAEHAASTRVDPPPSVDKFKPPVFRY